MTSAFSEISTRDAILEATERLMARYGFRKTTMEDIAHEARVSKRTIYTYFASKEDVGLSSIDSVVGRVHEELRRILRSESPAEIRLQRILERRVMGRIEAVAKYARSLDELFEAVRPEYLARRQKNFEVERDLIASVLRSSACCGEASDATADSLLLATNSLLPYSLSVAELGTPEAIKKRLDSMIAVLINGIFCESNRRTEQ